MYSGYPAAGAAAPTAQPAYAQQTQWPLQQQQQATQWPNQPPPNASQQPTATPDASNPAATAAWQQAWAHYAQQWQQQAVGAAAAAAAAATGGYGQTTTTTPAVTAAPSAPTAWSSYPQQQQQQQSAQTTVATPVVPPETLESFQKQFDDWERSYNKWLDENRNHPDKEAFKRYEQQWTSWRQQLLAKKELLKQQEQIQIQQQQAAHAAQTQWPPLHAPPAPPSLNGMHQQPHPHQQQQQQPPWTQVPGGTQQPQGPWAPPQQQQQQQQSAYPPQDNKGAYQQPPGQFNVPGLGQRQSQQPWLQRGSEENTNSRPLWGPGGPQGRDSGNNQNSVVGRDRSSPGRFGGRDGDHDRPVGDGNRRPFDREADRGNSRFDSGRGSGLGVRIGGAGGDNCGGSRFDGGLPSRFGVDKERGSRYDDRDCREQDKDRVDKDRDRGRRDREKGEERYGRRADDRGPRRSRFSDADDDRSGNANKEPLGRSLTNQAPRAENVSETTGVLQEKMLAMAGMPGGPDGRVGAPVAVPSQRGGFRGPSGRGGITGALNKRPSEDASAGELKRSRFEDADDDGRKPWDGSSVAEGPARGRGGFLMSRGGPPLRGGSMSRGGPDGHGGPLGRGGMVGRGPPGAPDNSSNRGGLAMRGGFGMRGNRAGGPSNTMIGHSGPMGLSGPPGGPPGSDVGGPPPFEAGYRGGMRGCRGGPPNFMRGGRGVRGGGPGCPMGVPGPDDGPFGGPPLFIDGPPPPWMNGPPGFGGDAPPMRGGRGGMRGGPGSRGGPSSGLGGGPTRGMMRGGSRSGRGGFRGNRGMFGGGSGGATDGSGGENDKDAGSFVDDDEGWGHARRGQQGPETPTERPCAKIVFEYGLSRNIDAMSLRKQNMQGTQPVETSVEMIRSGRLDFTNRRTESPPISRFTVDRADNRRNREPLYSRRRSPSPSAVVTRTRPPLEIPRPKPRTRPASDIFLPPLRDSRPPYIALILRGLPGSGKSQLCRKLKELEASHGAANEVRVMSIDDYYLVESEALVVSEDGCTVNKKEMAYVHDESMESTYEASLLKAFTKQLEARHFSLLIVDAPNTKMNSVNQLATAAKENQYTVLIMETEERDPKICYERNIHNRTLKDIKKMSDNWEDTTAVYVVLDHKTMRNNFCEAEMKNEHLNEALHGDTVVNSKLADDIDSKNDERRQPEDEDEATSCTWRGLAPSRWETMENTDETLSRLDGGGYKRCPNSSRSVPMEEFLAVTDDYETRTSSQGGGKKRVRWADIEERKQIDRAKAIGFVVGQTNWKAFTNSESEASAALKKTKYFDTETDE